MKKTEWHLICPKESMVYLQFNKWNSSLLNADLCTKGFPSRIIRACNSQDWGGRLTEVSWYHLLLPGKTQVSRISISWVASDVANQHLLCENLIHSKTPVMSTLHTETEIWPDIYLHVLEVEKLKKWTSKLNRFNQEQDSYLVKLDAGLWPCWKLIELVMLLTYICK